MEMFSVILLFIIFMAAIISIYRKIIFRGVDYKCFFSTDQAFEGDEIEFTEIVTNKKFFPVSWLKSELSLPKYLEFSELQSSVTDQTRFVTSFFSLRSFCRVRRTWKVKCLKRGNFKIESIVISASDILGTVKESFFADTENFRTSVLVMPRCDDYSMRIQGMSSESGDIFMDFGLISDPFFYSGVREYMITDSMKSINWYATAREQKLMVSKNDYTSDISITVILNIQSSPFDSLGVSFPERTEKCIRLCAAVIRDYCSQGKTVRLISNYQRNGQILDLRSADMISLFRVLAEITYDIGENFDRLLSCVVPEISDSEIIIVSSFETEFCEVIKAEKINAHFLYSYMAGGS